MPPSDLAAWAALVLLLFTAALGWILRRLGRGSFIARMRPHMWLGYAVLVLAFVHMSLSTSGMAGANTNGIWFATFALLGLGVQAFIGASLQSPGVYRAPLRRWHLYVFVLVLGLLFGHVLFNGPMAP